MTTTTLEKGRAGGLGEPGEPGVSASRLRFGLSLRWAAPLLALLVTVAAVTVFLWQRTAMPEPNTIPQPAAIDGNRAYGYLKTICEFGPRKAGSAANAKQRAYVAAHFKKMGAAVTEQPFAGRDPLTGAKVNMVNLKGSWFPDRTERVVLAAHYDTRPAPDQETDPALKQQPFLGANDGASGVALLMEIAHHLKESPTPWGVDLVIFDGEELVYGEAGEYFLGSKAFSQAYSASRRSGRLKYRYAAGFVLDMVGGQNLSIKQEPYSLEFAPNLVREVWNIADGLGALGFKREVGVQVRDDHLPMNDARIPTIDIIDFEYEFWHRAGDLPEACSATSLAQVGRVMTSWLALPKPKARGR